MDNVMKILKSILIWLCFIPVAILNGGLREHVLDGAIGEKWALPVSGIVLASCIFLITWLLLPRIGRIRMKGCVAIGLLWTFLTLLFELTFCLAGGNSLRELLAAYNPLTGNLWVLVLAATLLSPAVVRKI